MLLAITKFELQDIRKALLASSSRAEGYQEKVSTGLRVINAIISKGIEVVPATQEDIETLEDLFPEEIVYINIDDDELAEQGDY